LVALTTKARKKEPSDIGPTGTDGTTTLVLRIFTLSIEGRDASPAHAEILFRKSCFRLSTAYPIRPCSLRPGETRKGLVAGNRHPERA